ncbi:uncharacterized protein LOC108905677 [Anoplophora glabripennis]|uniref:uncharacterized protein LOC108905677 n=1 Tax=Anoplophora glabripennis TaxID=217634 RepID=UPI00087557D4|nr:uncharacterized protein LOC108905677 [Anoplophora glabripennis]
MFSNISLLILVLYLRCSHGDKECTMSEVLLKWFEKGNYGFYPGQRLDVTTANATGPTTSYVVTELAYYGKCLGFTTETFDTIVVDCPGAEKIGCFQVLTPQFNTQNNTISFTENINKICAKKVNEFCIGIEIEDKIINLNCHYQFMAGVPKSVAPYSFAGAIPINARPARA